jgi:hypothetical protein
MIMNKHRLSDGFASEAGLLSSINAGSSVITVVYVSRNCLATNFKPNPRVFGALCAMADVAFVFHTLNWLWFIP